MLIDQENKIKEGTNNKGLSNIADSHIDETALRTATRFTMEEDTSMFANG